MVGSSKTKRVSAWPRPISLASFSRWASPPERLGVASPKVRYPSPRSARTWSRWRMGFQSRQAARAPWMSMAMISGRV